MTCAPVVQAFLSVCHMDGDLFAWTGDSQARFPAKNLMSVSKTVLLAGSYACWRAFACKSKFGSECTMVCR